jgi:nitronate monooxygenase
VLELSDRPVLAAGGIATGRGLAAVLAAGAAGAWIGTPFLLARESRTKPAAQARIIESDETQTIYTSVYDRVQGKPWPAEFRGRALRNAFVDRWHEREDEMLASADAVAEFGTAKQSGDFTRAHIYAGQSVGALHDVESAAGIITRLESEATARLAACQAIIGTT